MDEATIKAIEESTATDQAIITTIDQATTITNITQFTTTALTSECSILERRQQVMHLCVHVNVSVCDALHVYMYCTCMYVHVRIYTVYIHIQVTVQKWTQITNLIMCLHVTHVATIS